MVTSGNRARRSTAWAGLMLGMAWLTTGCAASPDARYVYQDCEFGVIGIPRNSPYGRKNYDLQARELMVRHFPAGYEIVRAEEVVEGERTLATAIKKELETEPGLNALHQMLKLGKFAHSSSIDEKDVTHITESRILYRRRPEGPPTGSDGFASLASLAPALYLDPNEIARKVDKEALVVAKRTETDKESHKDKSSGGESDDKKTEIAKTPTTDDHVARASGPASSQP